MAPLNNLLKVSLETIHHGTLVFLWYFGPFLNQKPFQNLRTHVGNRTGLYLQQRLKWLRRGTSRKPSTPSTATDSRQNHQPLPSQTQSHSLYFCILARPFRTRSVSLSPPALWSLSVVCHFIASLSIFRQFIFIQ